MKTVGARLAIKQSRVEIVILVAAVAALTVQMLLTSSILRGLRLEECLTATPSLDCGSRIDAAGRQTELVKLLLFAAAAIPVFAAVVLGIAVVARELEQGTATLAWSFSISRRPWLLAGWLALAGAVVAISLVPAFVATELVAAANPTVDPAVSMKEYALRGWIVPARALAVFAVSVLVGLAMGRVLPSILIALVVAVLMVAALGAGVDLWLKSQIGELGASSTGDLVTDIRYRDPAGQLLTYEEAIKQLEPIGELPDGNYPLVRLGVPGSAHDIVEAVYVAVLFGVTILALAAAMTLIDRRAPNP